MSTEFLVQQTAHRHPDLWRQKMGALKTTQPATTVRRSAPSRPMEHTDQSGGHNVKSVNQPEQSASSGVKRAQQNFPMRMNKEANSNKLKD